MVAQWPFMDKDTIYTVMFLVYPSNVSPVLTASHDEDQTQSLAVTCWWPAAMYGQCRFNKFLLCFIVAFLYDLSFIVAFKLCGWFFFI